jgi:PAS domain S-box-containing protein
MAAKPVSEDPVGNDEAAIAADAPDASSKAYGDPLDQVARGLDSHAGAVLLADPQGLITYINHGMTALAGFKPEEMIGRAMTSFWIQSPAATKRMMAQLYADHAWQGELQHKKKRGQPFLELASISVILDEQGIVTGFFKWGLDVSDQKTGRDAHRLGEKNADAILDLIDGGFMEMDLRGTIIYANEGAAQVYRRPLKELRDLNFKDYMPAEEADRVSKIFNDVYRKVGPVKQTLTYDVVGKDGVMVRCEGVISLLKDGMGQPVGFGLFVRDVTETRKMEEALKESEESYRKLINTAPYSITIVHAVDRRYMLVNNAFLQRTGYTRDEVLGHTARDFNLYYDEDGRNRLADAFRRQGRVDNMEMRLQTRDGSETEILLSGRPIIFQGEPCNLFISTNIDDLKKAQRELMESEENARLIIESAPYSIVITRLADLRYVQVNDAFCRRTGYSREETIGKTGVEQNIYADQSTLQRLLEILYREEKVVGFEIPYRAKDGQILDSLVSVSPIRFRGEDCLLTISADLTERKRVERELEGYRLHLEKMVQERTRALEAARDELVKQEKLAVLGQLTATVSHELRNPLGVIRSSNFYLQRKLKERDEKVEKHMKRIEEQVRICDAIVADLLEYTRGRTVSIAMEDLAPWLEKVALQVQESESVGIILYLSDALPAVPHDQEKMRRAVINILHNAVQAVQAKQQAGHGAEDDYEPRIIVKTDRRDDAVIIEITDNGIGMNEETRERAFEPLFTTRARGTGIGLANVSKIVDEHGGKVCLESRPGEGTKVTIALPCTPDKKTAPPYSDSGA